MLTKTDFMEGIHIIQNNYNKKLSTEQLKLFYESTKDMNKDKYIANIKEHIKTNAFMPNIAQIRNENNNSNYEQRDYTNYDLEKFYAN